MHKYNTKIRVKNNNIFKSVGEIGCYLSHHTLLKHIKETSTPAKYTLILEDDGMLLKDAANIQHKLMNIDFDILYLGLNNYNKNKNITDDIYSIYKTKPIQGTHAYVVNNNNISKIYENTLTPSGPIDYHYEELIKNDKLNAFIIFPYLCVQDRESFHSTIKKINNNTRQRVYKKINIQSSLLVYDYQEEIKQRNLKNKIRLEQLVNPPDNSTAIKHVKHENTKPNNRKRVKNKILSKK